MPETDIDLNNLPNDPEELAKAFEKLESGEELPQSAAQQEDVKTGSDGEQKADPASAGQAEEDAAGVATKDGKHVIPYSVLKSERERASRAEQTLKEMQDRVSLLEGMVKQGGSQEAKDGERASTSQTDQQTANDLSDDDLESLKEDFPTVYKAVKAAMARAELLESKLKPVEESVRSSESERAQTTANAVQEAIDSVPKLAHIQATNAEAFDLAKQFDAALRAQAVWKDKPLSERFARVAEMVEAAVGPIDIPGAKAPAGKSSVDLKSAAKAKAAEAAKATRSDVPTSLSEFPAGQHAAQDEREAAESMTALQLAEKFAAMSPDQMEAYFRTL
jgi:hypothetical protein